jgi:hypothetical protein
MDEYAKLNKFKVVDLKAVLKNNGFKMTGNKPDLIQRIIDVGLVKEVYDNKSVGMKYRGRTKKSKVMVDYDYDNMTVAMLKTLLKGYMLKLTGRKKDLVERIKAHVSKQDDDDEDFKPKVIRRKDPTLEELEALELPKYVPTNLLLPKKKEVSDQVADESVEDIGITLNKLIDIGKNIDSPLTTFKTDNMISYIAYLNLYNKYNKKSIIVTKYYSILDGLGIYIRIPKINSKEFMSGILFDNNNKPLDIETLVHDIAYYITKYNENAIVIPFVFVHTTGGHANLLVYRPREQILEWFEPHNTFIYPEISNYIKTGLLNLINSSIFKRLLGHVSLLDTHVLVGDDKYGTITPSKKLRLQGGNTGGTCMLWCVLIAELVFLNPQLTTTEIIRDIFGVALNLDKRITINNIMKGYIVEIEKGVNKYLDEFLKKSDYTDIEKEYLDEWLKQYDYTDIKYENRSKAKDLFLSNIFYKILIPRIKK